MKKILSTLCMALMGVAMMAQQPVITFEKTEHDFGKINEGDGRVSVVFSFKNEGMAPLVLSNVRASCGCTTPTWTREPVEPGQTGSITVTYNPNGRPGRFQKTVTITSNASEPTTKVYIKGEVIPKQAKPANKYTVQVGELSMKTQSLNLGTLTKGAVKGGELEYANLTKEAHNVDLATTDFSALATQVTLPTVQANEIGKFVFSLDTKAAKLYGPVETNVYVVIDGKRVLDNAHKLTINAEIVEDFSQMSVEQKQQAPILEIANEIDLGEVEAGKKSIKKTITFTNTNVAPLFIRRVYNPYPNVLACTATSKVNGGKKGKMTVTLNTFADGKPMAAGQYSRQITLYTNDPSQAKKVVTIKWTVK
jgi:hypothetical protein